MLHACGMSTRKLLIPGQESCFMTMTVKPLLAKIDVECNIIALMMCMFMHANGPNKQMQTCTKDDA